MKADMLFLNKNPQFKVDESVCIILQPMHGDDIDYKIGPLVIQFESTDDRNTFFDESLGAFVAKLKEKYGADFQPIHATDPDDGPNVEVIE